jgi:hypothetical protein
MDECWQQEWNALQEVANNCCKSWFGKLKPDDPTLEKRFMAAFDSAFPAVFSKVLSRHEDMMEPIAAALLERWIKDGSVAVDEPTENVRYAIESGLDNYGKRRMSFVDAARQRKVKALALAESGVPVAQVARDLSIATRTAKAWIEEERRELEDLKKTLQIYGYTIVKEQPKKRSKSAPTS